MKDVEEKKSTKEDIKVEEATMQDTMQKEPLELENLDLFKFLIVAYRNKVVELIQEGFLSQEVANKLMDDFTLNIYNQFVKIGVNIS